jgi:hypothetical protein
MKINFPECSLKEIDQWISYEKNGQYHLAIFFYPVLNYFFLFFAFFEGTSFLREGSSTFNI